MMFLGVSSITRHHKELAAGQLLQEPTHVLPLREALIERLWRLDGLSGDRTGRFIHP